MQFAEVPEFSKDFKKLYKKYKSLPDDLELRKKVLALFPTGRGNDVDQIPGLKNKSEAPPTGVGGFPAYPPSLHPSLKLRMTRKLRRVTSRIAEPAVAGDKSLPEYTLFAFIHRQSRWLSAKAGKIFKARLMCRTLKREPLRLIYCYEEELQKITLIEMYFKGNQSVESRDRIFKYFL